MTDQSQEDIDALMGEADGSSDSAVEESSNPALDEDTQKTSAVQGEVSDLEEGRPWVDYIPTDIRKKPENLEERITRRQEDTAFWQEEAELHILEYAKGGIDEAYRRQWVLEANNYFRLSVILKRRKERYGFGKPENSSEGPHAEETLEQETKEEAS